ncbi:MAG: hypothetical protein F6K10_13385 [Moorea sp. SIO2B7]|nr:hypothetical protein [Moorena sp. SIO2B7]
MKMMKLMMATALATGFTMGAFIESAEAQFRRRRGAGYSERNFDEQAIFTTFILFDKKPDGQAISDTNSLVNLGSFPGAIKNFNTYSSFNTGRANHPVDFDMLETPDEFADVANLETRWFKNSELGDDPLNLMGGFMGDIIEYKIVGQGNTNNEPEPKFFYLLNPTPAVASLIREKNLLLTSTLEIIFSLPNGFTPEQATNDLEYILDNNLLNRAIILEEDLSIPNVRTIDQALKEGKRLGGLGGLRFEQEIDFTTSVPESTPVGSLLGLGVLGVALGLKPRSCTIIKISKNPDF